MSHDAVLLSAQNLHLRRGGRELYAGLNFSIASGQVIWLKGRNGAGKSSLLRILAGLMTPEHGLLRWKQQEFASRLDESGPAMVLLDERLGLSKDLSVEANLRYCAALYQQAWSSELLAAFDLAAMAQRPVGQLSTGQKKRCALARLSISRAPLWLLDEPANGLDTQNRQRLGHLIAQQQACGGAVIFASHDELPLGELVPDCVELG